MKNNLKLFSSVLVFGGIIFFSNSYGYECPKGEVCTYCTQFVDCSKQKTEDDLGSCLITTPVGDPWKSQKATKDTVHKDGYYTFVKETYSLYEARANGTCYYKYYNTSFIQVEKNNTSLKVKWLEPCSATGSDPKICPFVK